MKAKEKYVEEFWKQPTETVVELMREVRSRHSSQYAAAMELVDLSKEVTPKEPMYYPTVSSWFDGLRSVTGTRRRSPNLNNGVRLFRLLLTWAQRQEA